MGTALIPLKFRALCDGIPSGEIIQLVEPGNSYYRFVFPPSGHGIWTSHAYTFELLLNHVQWIDQEDGGRVLHAQTIMSDCNGYPVGRSPWYAWADITWPTDIPVGVLHYPERVPLFEEDKFHAFSLVTWRISDFD